MSQRPSGYDRKENDNYETPAWVTEALLPHLRTITRVWEPAAGSGKIVETLKRNGLDVVSTDLIEGADFCKTYPLFTDDELDLKSVNAIITNPPYGLAQAFIEHAIKLMKPNNGLVAMLLRTDYDHAKTRQHLFSGCSIFAKKLVLTKRIVWFERPGAAPSFNHAWFMWDWLHEGPPVIAYA